MQIQRISAEIYKSKVLQELVWVAGKNEKEEKEEKGENGDNLICGSTSEVTQRLNAFACGSFEEKMRE